MTKILYSKSTRRCIISDPLGNTDCLILKDLPDGIVGGEVIHSAPIGLEAMSESFSNKDIHDWEEKEILSFDNL